MLSEWGLLQYSGLKTACCMFAHVEGEMDLGGGDIFYLTRDFHVALSSNNILWAFFSTFF